MKIIDKIIYQYNKLTDRKIPYTIQGRINTFEIEVPYDHHLPIYQNKFKLYDKMLGKIAAIIYTNHGGKCIDIGANIGDTALAILAECNMEVLCIEGDPAFYNTLQKNTKNISKVTTYNAFVGDGNHTTGMVLEKSFGTGKLVKSDMTGVSTMSLEQILSSINMTDITLIKSDTDGYDFDILMSHKNFILMHKPSLFLEYDFFNTEDDHKALSVISFLIDMGYNFIIYDNFGNFMNCITKDHLQYFEYLNRFILSSKNNGGGIYYADIFATTDSNIFEQVKNINI